MIFTLSPEKTLLLDRLIRTTKSEMICIEADSTLQVHLTAPDLSQMTIIRLESCFFEEFENRSHVRFAIPRRKFYETNMKKLKVSLEKEKVVLDYTFNTMKYRKSFCSLDAEIFDIKFNTNTVIDIELHALKKVLGDIKDKKIKIQQGDKLKICGQNIEISIQLQGEEKEFVIDTEKLKAIIQASDIFYSGKMSFSSEDSPLSIILESPEMQLTTFISIE
ncbi:hypothetical protein GINT2_001593 [Glugoides intestinalis]